MSHYSRQTSGGSERRLWDRCQRQSPVVERTVDLSATVAQQIAADLVRTVVEARDHCQKLILEMEENSIIVKRLPRISK